MPCNSDYMMPSQNEIKELGDKCIGLKSVADAMVYNADVIRDIVLATGGDFSKLAVRDALELGRRVAEHDGLMSEGRKIANDISFQYAYYSSSSYHKSNADKVMAGYQRASVDFTRAHAAGKALIEEDVVPKSLIEDIENDQVKHRIEDVKRLIPIFTAKGDFKKVELLAKVDFTLPLEPQLGFSPDDF